MTEKKNNKLIIKLITYSLPITFFLLLELGLRLFGYGQTVELFIDTPDSEHFQLPRPDIVKRYFPQGADVPSVTMEANLFLKEKPENGLRIFVQGGSTAAGFPYGLGASIAGMLDKRLKQSFPEHYVEVVNTAMSAVNSYTLLDFADEIIEQQPDAVLIYVGHNEYLGILGVGSNYARSYSHEANLMLLKFRNLRIFQLAQNIHGWFNEAPAESEDETRRTLMARVAKHKNIETDSELYFAGLTQFKNNLSLLLEKYKDAGIPVFISSVASNLRDHPPFASVELSNNEKRALVQLQRQAQMKRVNSELLEQVARLAADEKKALLYFHLGKVAFEVKDYENARRFFTLAKEYDLLRFRAPEAVNEIIAQLGQLHGAHLVNYHRTINQSSAGGIVGNDFMLEHLHPNLQGYFILADNFYQTMKMSGVFDPWPMDIEPNQAWRDRPVLPAEEYFAFAKIEQLKSDYPFTETPKSLSLPKPADWSQELGLKYFKKEIGWLEMMNRSFKEYLDAREIPMVMKTSQIIADAMPWNAEANFRVGRQLMQARQYELSQTYFYRSALTEPDNAIYRIAYANALRLNRKFEKAREHIEDYLKTHQVDAENQRQIDALIEQLNKAESQ